MRAQAFSAAGAGALLPVAGEEEEEEEEDALSAALSSFGIFRLSFLRAAALLALAASGLRAFAPSSAFALAGAFATGAGELALRAVALGAPAFGALALGEPDFFAAGCFAALAKGAALPALEARPACRTGAAFSAFSAVAAACGLAA